MDGEEGPDNGTRTQDAPLTEESARRSSGGSERRVGRRQVLAATATIPLLGGVAGCLSSLGGSDGYRVRPGADGDWRPVTPVETGSTHRDAYCGSEADSCETAKHGLDRSNAVSMFVHRAASDGGTTDALMMTYDTPDDSGGTAVLQLDEQISPEEDLVVADGPIGEGGNTGDSYKSDRFTHTWAKNFTDGAVIAVDALSEPTLEFVETEGIDEILVFSGSDPESAESYSFAIDTPVTFDL